MNKKDFISVHLVHYFGCGEHINACDTVKITPPEMRATLEAIYDEGISKGYLQGQQSVVDNPGKPQYTVTVEATGDTLEVYNLSGGSIKVYMIDADGMVDPMLIPCEYKDNATWLADQCASWRLGTFAALVDILVKM